MRFFTHAVASNLRNSTAEPASVHTVEIASELWNCPAPWWINCVS